jgi:PAS domain S-box-containing protein
MSPFDEIFRPDGKGLDKLDAPDAPASGTPQTLKILVVDDAQPSLTTIETLLTAAGHRVVTATNGFEAVEKFTLEEPDLVLMDVVMPGLDGYSAARRIKALSTSGRWVPVIMLTSLDAPEDFERGLEAGADDYLTKPINAALLTAKVKFMKRVLNIQTNLFQMQRFQHIFDHVLDGIVVANERGLIVSYNRAAERIFGYRADEAIGRSVAILMPIPESHRHDAYMARYRSSGHTTIMGVGRDISGKRKDGSIFPISVGLTEVEWAGARHFIGVVSDISERKRMEHVLKETTAHLQQYRDRSEEEKAITHDLLEKIVRRASLDDPLLEWYVQPSEIFSGDVIAAHRAPDGRLFVVSADATGHGLAAAISLLPVIGIFYAMVEKSFTVPEIVSEMNKRMSEMMPVGRFLSAAVIAIDEKRKVIEIWNGGMPENMIVWEDGSLIGLPPIHPALGILSPDRFDSSCRELTWDQPGYLIALSDGIPEAANSVGEAFGLERVKEAARGAAGKSPFQPILDRMTKHLAGIPAHDDRSIAVIKLP